MNEKFTKWDVSEQLRTKEQVCLYLEACVDEDPGDGSLIRAALNDIARAQNMSALARDAELDMGNLHETLSEDGNPTLATLLRVTPP